MNKKIKSIGLLGASFGMLISLGLGSINVSAKEVNVKEVSPVMFTAESSVVGNGELISVPVSKETSTRFVSEGDSTIDSLLKNLGNEKAEKAVKTGKDKKVVKPTKAKDGKTKDVKPTVEKDVVTVTDKVEENHVLVSAVDSQVSKNVAKAEKTVDEKVQEKVKVIKSDLNKAGIVIKEGTGVDSNTDTVRREALNKEYGITLTDKDVWENKKGQTSVNPDGTVSEYTSHEEMKALGFYTVNANRQELIQYAIRTGDWYPYRALEAKDTPLYFELVNGKHEYSKVYYANQFEHTYHNYNSQVTAVNTEGGLSSTDRELKVKEIREAQKRELTKIADSYKKAPGSEMYVIGLNHREDFASEWGVKQVENGWFDSKLNDPKVKAEGKFTVK